MPKAPSAPPPIDVNSTIQKSYETNLKSSEAGQAMSSMNQSTPIGTLDYQITGTDPNTGAPIRTATTQYTPEQQALFDILQGSKGITGTSGQNLAANMFGTYSNAPDFSTATGSLTDQLTAPMAANLQRFQNQATAQKNTDLLNKGITPGSPAYNQAMDELANQQQLTYAQGVAAMEPQAYNQAIQSYQTPANMMSQLMGLGTPGDVKSSLVNTPQASVQPTDVAGITAQSYDQQYKAYQAQVQQQNAMMGGLMGLGSAGINAFAKGPWSMSGSYG